eukprot:3017836-Rhodomonas_salina.1
MLRLSSGFDSPGISTHAAACALTSFALRAVSNRARSACIFPWYASNPASGSHVCIVSRRPSAGVSPSDAVDSASDDGMLERGASASVSRGVPVVSTRRSFSDDHSLNRPAPPFALKAASGSSTALNKSEPPCLA